MVMALNLDQIIMVMAINMDHIIMIRIMLVILIDRYNFLYRIINSKSYIHKLPTSK